MIKDTPLADSKTDLLELAKINDSDKQKQVTQKIKRDIFVY
ncbi:hypothetical protein [Thermoanaerobacterium thermosaccharolyticum]